MAAPAIQVTIDKKALDKAIANIAKYEGRPLERRAKQAYIAGARLLDRSIRNQAPVGPTGNLRRSVSARSNRLRAGEMAAATVGTRFKIARHRHLVVDGTKPHTLAPKRPGKGPWVAFLDERGGDINGFVGPGRYVKHPGSKANPFVDRAVQPLIGEVQSFINARVLDLGESFTASIG